ncbi:Hypothetical protein GbCGDNIH9_8600 [Granulibacter bethesdensis]|uniref:Uncharacterized protein n=1 Tax=Granulibacter bethesdensis TaxID=364410 RepID=A0AAC9KA70_9PROT|nr:Hypothetical protein GbCGDNIH9_8600 [Granulibacter bethesdensis]APH62482.1 Hypothetical protein GbCGDNIH8_8600 [Granulibacter bethesdensis]
MILQAMVYIFLIKSRIVVDFISKLIYLFYDIKNHEFCINGMKMIFGINATLRMKIHNINLNIGCQMCSILIFKI